MARSSYIYIVTAIGTGTKISAFTVKHECQKFLSRIGISGYQVWRFKDGNTNMKIFPDVFTAERFMENGRTTQQK